MSDGKIRTRESEIRTLLTSNHARWGNKDIPKGDWNKDIANKQSRQWYKDIPNEELRHC